MWPAGDIWNRTSAVDHTLVAQCPEHAVRLERVRPVAKVVEPHLRAGLDPEVPDAGDLLEWRPFRASLGLDEGVTRRCKRLLEPACLL